MKGGNSAEKLINGAEENGQRGQSEKSSRKCVLSKVGPNPAIMEESKANYQSYHLAQEQLQKMIAEAHDTEYATGPAMAEEREDRDTVTLNGETQVDS